MATSFFKSCVVFQCFTVSVQSSGSPLSVHNNLLCSTKIDTLLVLIWIILQQLGDVFFSCSVLDLQQESGIAACWCFDFQWTIVLLWSICVAFMYVASVAKLNYGVHCIFFVLTGSHEDNIIIGPFIFLLENTNY